MVDLVQNKWTLSSYMYIWHPVKNNQTFFLSNFKALKLDSFESINPTKLNNWVQFFPNLSSIKCQHLDRLLVMLYPLFPPQLTQLLHSIPSNRSIQITHYILYMKLSPFSHLSKHTYTRARAHTKTHSIIISHSRNCST